MISRNLELSLNLAVQIAQEQGHEFVGVEHILFALLENPEARKAILACGGSIEQTKLELENFFLKKCQKIILEKKAIPQPTLAFQRVLQLAAQQVLSAGKNKIFGDTVLIAMYSEKESFAVYYLEKQGIRRFDLVNFSSHGTVKEGVDIEDLSEEDDDGEGVQARLNPSKDKTESESGDKAKQKKKSDPLTLYTVDLCEKAKLGKIDPIIGRGAEIERIVQILCRRRKNNPLFVGDSGVGKTALVEGLALKITEKDVPDFLAETKIYSLEMGTLLAGTKFRGDFEQRLKGVINHLKKNKKSILFIDEIHTIMGAGAVSGGSLDASNILKPFLTNDEVKCIGSTTYKEYRQHIENDHALTRRFQRINIEEPSPDNAIKILRGLKGNYERYHKVTYSNESLKAAVELSHLHIKDRKLPDKAIDIIDEAGAALVAKRTADVLTGKNKIGVTEIKAVLAKMARIPPERLSSADKSNLRNLGVLLRRKIFGQDAAIDALDRVIRMSRSGLANNNKPIGSFLFSGPTGVGKTELAKQLALLLGINFIRFDMSEYMEKHAVSRLIGAPPGYVGYNEGGLLTDAVHQNPHCVLLMDEIEKAHFDVHNVLLQVMDHGTLTDSNGRKTDFQNVIIIMTTNVGAEELSKVGIGFSHDLDADGKDKAAIRSAFSPEFRNRLDGAISFNPLPQEIMIKIVEKNLKELEQKLKSKKVKWHIEDSAKKYLAEKGFAPAYGARPLARVIEEDIKKPLADELLFGSLKKGGEISISFDKKLGRLVFEFS